MDRYEIDGGTCEEYNVEKGEWVKWQDHRKERNELIDQIIDAGKTAKALMDINEELQAERGKYKKALEEYGQHRDDCTLLHPDHGVCSCGLDEALQGKEA